MRSSRPLICTICALAVLAAVARFAGESGTTSEESAPLVPHRSGVENPEVAGAALAIPPTSSEPLETPVVEWYAEHFGDDWESVRSRVSPEQIEQLTIPSLTKEEAEIALRTVLPLNDDYKRAVAAHFMRWNGKADADYIARFGGLKLTPEQIRRVEEIVLGRNAEIEPVVGQLVARLDGAMEREYAAKRYQLVPGSSALAPKTAPRKNSFWGTGRVIGGWCAGFMLSWDDHPDLVVYRDQVAELVRQRDESVADYLASIR